MIMCDGCQDWFHGKCVGLKEEDSQRIDRYYCPTCNGTLAPVCRPYVLIETNGFHTEWKGKCRNPGCGKRASGTYGFCSQTCGLTHAELRMQYRIKQTAQLHRSIAASLHYDASAVEVRDTPAPVPGSGAKPTGMNVDGQEVAADAVCALRAGERRAMRRTASDILLAACAPPVTAAAAAAVLSAAGTQPRPGALSPIPDAMAAES